MQADRARIRAGREPWLPLPGVLVRRSLPRKGARTRPGSIAHSVHITLRGLRKRWVALGTSAQVTKPFVTLSTGRQGPLVQQGFVGSNPTPSAVTGEGRWFGTERTTGLRCSWPQFSEQRGLVDGGREPPVGGTEIKTVRACFWQVGGSARMLPMCPRAPQPLMSLPQKNGGAGVCPRPLSTRVSPPCLRPWGTPPRGSWRGAAHPD